MSKQKTYRPEDLVITIGGLELTGFVSLEDAESCSYCDNGREDECTFGCKELRAIREAEEAS